MEIYRFGNEVAFGVWNLRIETEKNKFIAQFHDYGWFHTINEPFETAAIVSRSSIYDDDFKKIKIEDSFKKNIPLADVLYWLTGGNRVWLFDTEPNIVGEYPAEFTVEYYGKQLSEAMAIYPYHPLKEKTGCLVSQKEHTVIVEKEGCTVTTL